MARVPPRHNLPAPLDSFIGRQRELAVATDALAQTRLLTLTGVGGCGKTQLALRVANDLLPRFAEGTWLVQLAPLVDPSLVPLAIATTLGVHGRSGQPILGAVMTALATQRLLLVLDNCEHLILACAQAVEALLRGCPHLCILATSREPLRISGEVVRRVPPLTLPAPDAGVSPESLAQVEAVTLFVDRAHARQPAFRLTSETAPAVVNICLRLEGLPLAIELAAAQMGMLSAEQIASQLDQSLRLLGGGSRTLPRQETLRSTLDWSFALLTDAERVLLRRLSVFAGGFDLQAAEGVCSDKEVEAADVRGVLSNLVDKSLVEAQIEGRSTRYRLLEPTRQYAFERLDVAHETATLERRHAGFWVEMAQAAEPQLMSAHKRAAIERLTADRDNLRAAFIWSRRGTEPQDLELGARLAAAVCWFWAYQGDVGEGLDWLETALAKRELLAPEVRAKALHGAGELSWLLGQNTLARERLEESASVYRALADKRGLAYVLQVLAMVPGQADAIEAAEESRRLFVEEGDAWGAAHATLSLGVLRQAGPDGERVLEEALSSWRALGDEWGMAQTLNFLGDLARSKGDDACAAAHYQEALDLLRNGGLSGSVPSLLHNLGQVALRARDSERAGQLMRESLILFRNRGDQPGVGDCLEGLAAVWVGLERLERAAMLFGAAEALREATGSVRWPANAADVGRNLTSLRARMSPATLAEAWAAGRALSLQHVMDEALAGVERHSPDATAERSQAAESDVLSPRELEVAALIVRGLTNKEIGSHLVISERTASTHVAHILNKLGLRTRVQIAAWGVQRGLGETSSVDPRCWGAAQPSVIVRITGTPREISQSDDVGARGTDLP